MRIKTLIMFLFFSSAAFAQNYSIDWYVIASGGGHAESDNYQTDGTIGQWLVGTMSSPNYIVESGYWVGGQGGGGGGCGFYVTGDYNGSESFNVADIISSFSKLKTGSPDAALPCECPQGSGNVWAVAMDVNNTCAFNVADVIAGFSKLKTGSPELIPCELCPPDSPSPIQPGNEIILIVPNLEAKTELNRSSD
ncbi:MAG: hypothetical protein V3W18_11790 [candidate division Zixibacteria bacterium]